MSQPSNSWKHYEKHVLYPYSSGFWQKVFSFDQEKIAMELVSYKPILPQVPSWSYELHIQIPENLSITKMTINISNFSYRGKDINWKEIEEQGLKIIKALVKKEFLKLHNF